MELEALDHVGLTVTDVARSVRWYQEVLGLHRAHEEAWGDFPAVLEANGSGGVALFPGTPTTRRRPWTRCATSRSAPRGEGWTRPRTSSTLAGSRSRNGTTASPGRSTCPTPDGHLVEITTYEVTRG
jgi:catechol 2,3-dioxygenase-like lactoylglutathione lyase family enzyme